MMILTWHNMPMRRLSSQDGEPLPVGGTPAMRDSTAMVPVSLKKDALDFSAVGGALVVAQVAALGTNMLVARAAGASVFGQFTTFITVVAVVATVGNALDATFIRLSGQATSPADHESERRAHLIANLSYAALTALIGLALLPWLQDVGALSPDAALVYCAGMIVGGLVSVYNALLAQYRQEKRFVESALLLPAFNLCAAVGVLVLVLSSSGVTSGHLATAYLIAAVGLALLAIVVIVRSSSLAAGAGPTRIALARNVNVAVPLMAAALITMLSSRLDVFFLSTTVSFEDLGFYGVGLRIAIAVGFLNASLALMIQPRAATALHGPDERRGFARFSSMCCLLILFAAGAIFIFANPIIKTLFGAPFLPAREITCVLLVQAVFNGWYLPFKALLECHRPTTLVFTLSCVQLLVAAGLMVLLVPRHGAIGAAIAVTGASGVGLVLFAGSALKVLKRHETQPVAAPVSGAGGSIAPRRA